jgi:phosphoserine phosphatase
MQHDGAYDGFDPEEFTSRSGGKREAVQHIKQARACLCVHVWNEGLAKLPHLDAWPVPAASCQPSPIPPNHPRTLQTHGYSTVVMVGDGITDFEARAEGGADAFIGCGWAGAQATG